MKFDFKRLISKYSTEFIVITKDKGHYNELGDYVQGVGSETTGTGTILDMSQRTIYNSNGVYTTKDKSLYTLSPIEDKSQVKYRGNVYHVQPDRGNDNAVFAGVYSYILKWVSVFD